jgi:hypothetical protein
VPASLGEPIAADASLHLLADHLATAVASGEVPPCLLHVGSADAEGFDLGVLPLDGEHPTTVLLGRSAPPEWHAVGLASSGWAYHVSDRGDPNRRRHRVHVVSLVSRSGEHAHRSCSDDPELDAKLAGEPPAGEQVDLLRRCLELPTDPAPCEPSAYWAIQWLVDIADAAPPVTTIEDAVARHPAMRLLRHGVRLADADTTDVLGAFHRVLTWSRLRALAVAGRFEVPELAPDDAGWLDDGAFARFLLNRCPPLHLLRARLHEHVPPPVAAAVEDLLDHLDVPDVAWPDLQPSRP